MKSYIGLYLLLSQCLCVCVVCYVVQWRSW